MSLSEVIIVFKNNACTLGGKTFERGDACPICIDGFCESDPVCVTACQHVFHTRCVVTHFWKTPRCCPVCCGDAYGNFTPEWARSETSEIHLLGAYLRGQRDASPSPRTLSVMVMLACFAILLFSFLSIVVTAYLKEQAHLAEQNAICDNAHPSWYGVCRTRFRRDAQEQFCDLVHPLWRNLCRIATPEQLELADERRNSRLSQRNFWPHVFGARDSSLPAVFSRW